MLNLKVKLKNFRKMYKKQNLAPRSLILLGFLLLFNTCYKLLCNMDLSNESDIALRSIMQSIFGYIIGENVKTSYGKSNDFQILIISVLSVLCIITLILSDFLNIDQNAQNIVAIRSLLASSIGFLINKSSNMSKNNNHK